MTEDTTVRTTWPGTETFDDWFACGQAIGAGAEVENLLLVLSVQKRNGLAAG